jgi:Tol biopolymer transport system component
MPNIHFLYKLALVSALVLTTQPLAALSAVNAQEHSPGKILFAADYHRGANSSEDWQDIYIVDSDGKNRSKLTDSQKYYYHPVWSPDGKQIAFVAQGNVVDRIYVMDANGQNQLDVSGEDGSDTDPMWSPDGKQIVFVYGRHEIFVVDSDGKNRVNVANRQDGSSNADPAWSPDGTRIAFSSLRDGNRDIYLMDPDGKNLINLTQSATNERSPIWSPDGRRIIFVWEDEGNRNAHNAIMDADGNNIAKFYGDHGAAWSPDGMLVAVEVYGTLATVDASGANSHTLTGGYAPVWSPDGKQIAYYNAHDYDSSMLDSFVVGLDGKTPIQLNIDLLPADQGVGIPSWQPVVAQ